MSIDVEIRRLVAFFRHAKSDRTCDEVAGDLNKLGIDAVKKVEKYAFCGYVVLDDVVFGNSGFVLVEAFQFWVAGCVGGLIHLCLCHSVA